MKKIINNPSNFVEEYIEVLKKFVTIKAAKEAGATELLLYPNKVLKHISDNPEIFDEDTLTRWSVYTNPLQGKNIYDLITVVTFNNIKRGSYSQSHWVLVQKYKVFSHCVKCRRMIRKNNNTIDRNIQSIASSKPGVL